ncbi:MAG: bifunctional diaminohydroxyphosphoribosylaminopyrimidine deaminase/5-amino-6-(5-phosphoribosylamino)uracil reductase RibD [Limnochordaceae bacterium]|nr:bifunctional diaminohydroxyphosphoribosylaminopyrimidine deaminase/5-amino-6-(5-phosphoribosylamino)uracil reductase RibD [Limnochordaceae bacterium]
MESLATPARLAFHDREKDGPRGGPLRPLPPAIRPDGQEARWIRRALALAARGVGTTHPNPAVGAVLVRDGSVVGEGYHRKAGGPHAEVVALRQAGPMAEGATLYVTLEPCAHWGRTPPCADALIAAGVRRVVACTVDPNPKVLGRGFEKLRAAGVDVRLAGEPWGLKARKLNAAYEKYITTGLPFVTLKVAMSLDGKIATASGESQWITGERARALGRRLRARHDAVMVGIGTALADDPLLTVRDIRGKPAPRQPLRVVVDSAGRLPPSARLVRSASPEAPVVVAVTDRAPGERVTALRSAGLQVQAFPRDGTGRVDLRSLLQWLASAREVTGVLVEGGATLHGAFLESGLVDALEVFVAPKLLGGASAVPAIGGRGASRIGEAWQVARWRWRAIPNPSGPPDLLIEALLPEAERRLSCSAAS